MSFPQNPRATVFIPVHNRERYIEDALQSILAQDFQDFDILLIDDDRPTEASTSCGPFMIHASPLFSMKQI